MNLLCVSDIHGKSKKLPELVAREDIDLVLFIGDITHRGGYKEAQEVLMPALEGRHPVYAIPGNMDARGVMDFLNDKAINLHGRGICIDDIGFMGVGGGNPSPFGTPFELSEEEFIVLLEEGYQTIKDCPVKVLVSHTPPYKTVVDKIKSGLHVGSQAVRDFILDKKINYCISGHIHEAYGTDLLGTTHCINPGALREGRFSLIKIDKNNGLEIIAQR